LINIPFDTIKDKIKESSGLTGEEIDQRIKKKLDQLSGLISKEGAAHILANELGVKLSEPTGSVKIKDLMNGLKNIETVGKVIRKYDVREFSTEKRSGKIGKILIGDETGTTMIVFWNDKADLLTTFKEGDLVKFLGATARENNGRVEIHLTDMSTIEVNPQGAKIEVSASFARPVSQRKKISELTEADQNIEVLGTVVQIFDLKFFKISADTGKKMKEDDAGSYTYGCVLNLFVDDGSDNIRTVLWKNQILNLLGLSEQQVLELKDAPDLFEQKKTDLLGLIVKISGRVNKNTLFNRLELVANTVIRDVNPEDEMRRLDSTTKTEKKVEVKEVRETVKETAKYTEDKDVKKPSRGPPKETSSVIDLDDDLLSLEDIEDLEDDL